VRILCADDNRFVREAIRYTLAYANYAVECAEDGWQALELILDPRGNFDVLITDHDMPKLNGLDLVRQLKLEKLPLKIIVLSGSLTDENCEDYERLGVDAILHKPCLPQEIVDAVTRCAAAQASHATVS
jgi:CheY-like chemotaxis protein